MDELIINEFYNKILIEATGGVIDIDGFKFNIEFQTKNGSSKYLNGNVFETLEIKNKELFDKLLILYTKKMYEFIMSSNLKNIDYVYYEGNKTYIIDFILSSVWNNVTDLDLQNPIEYLKNRINFFSDPLYYNESDCKIANNIEYLCNSDIVYSIKINNPVLETPYSFCPYIIRDKNNKEVFDLPKIYYGISNNECYIYSVKNDKNRNSNSYSKKINRILYKVNKNVEDNYELDNIKDVSPSALMSIGIFIKLLKDNNITKINAVDYMPIRYKAKEKAIMKKVGKLKGKVSFDEFNKIIDENLKEQERIQNNMTDKLIRNFRRMEYQLGDVRIVSYPKDIDSMMHLKIDGEPILSDNILNVIYNYSEKEYKK